ncbi:hypothetical protein XYCOK13_02310 [Xylanibacillus composti]|uniref:Uncharacterized protein n=1 Tax=Xylanibacillus composti TaxID=1572762 RepID=A0A8J4H0Y2_9BACL|nr:hypothetical protein XYCOK13_02310 [Xylanibacillus composti]
MIVEPEVSRLEKLERYYNHFNVENRYGLSFPEFKRKVDEGTWAQYLEERMTLPQHVRELCSSR